MAAMSGSDRRFELLIDRGTIVDGTGAPGFAGAVGISREHAGASARLTVLREQADIEDAIGRSGRVVDARDRVVAPAAKVGQISSMEKSNASVIPW